MVDDSFCRRFIQGVQPAMSRISLILPSLLYDQFAMQILAKTE